MKEAPTLLLYLWSQAVSIPIAHSGQQLVLTSQLRYVLEGPSPMENLRQDFFPEVLSSPEEQTEEMAVFIMPS